MSSPFILGVVIGILLNFSLRYLPLTARPRTEGTFPRNTDVVSEKQSRAESPGDKVSLEEVLAPAGEKTQEETQKEEKNFVRPRFVKVSLLLSLEADLKLCFAGGTEHHEEAAGRHHPSSRLDGK